MAKLTDWKNLEQVKAELGKRCEESAKARRSWEKIWEVCLRASYRNGACDVSTMHGSQMFMPPSTNDSYLRGPTRRTGSGLTNESKIYPEVYCNYLQRDIRYLHSQLSNNPPSVVPQPTSTDPKDKRAAEAANAVVKHSVRQYRLNEKKDWMTLWALVCGTGVMKLCFDPSLGEPVEYNPETMEITTEGDIGVTIPSIYDMYFDPTATNYEEIRWAFQAFKLPEETAKFMFGEEPFKQRGPNLPDGVVEVMQYWEKGMPVNGMQGRFCWCLRDGTLLGAGGNAPCVMPNPHGPLKKLNNGAHFRTAKLPFLLFTDIDMLGSPYGIPTILFTAELQNELNVIDLIILTNTRAHGSNRMLVSEDTELGDDSISNDPLDIIRYTGTKPDFIAGKAADSSVMNLRAQLAGMIPDLDGVNDAQLGKMTRETSGTAMSYASQNGQALRARTFSKYVQMVEDLYRSLLQICQEKWSTPRKLVIAGSEKAHATIDFINSNLDGGYEFASLYGTDFSLDPVERRKEILTLWPLLKEMKIDARQLGSLLRLNDLNAMLATIDLAYDRQMEIFDRMINDPVAAYIPPEEGMDNQNMLAYAYNFRMTAEFDRLTNPAVKANIMRHIKEREALELAKSQPAAGTPGDTGTPGEAPAGAAPAVNPAAGMTMPEVKLSSLLGTGHM